MKISILIPTNRTSTSAVARVLEAASLDPAKFEVIVRDNSENDEKRSLLASIHSPALRTFIVSNRGAIENSVEALKLATGDFVLFLADDDWISTRGLQQLHALGAQHVDDESIAGLSGSYLIQTSAMSGTLRYEDLDSADPVARLNGYIRANAPNVLYYAAIRRPLMATCFEFMESMPYKFSFHDILMVLLYMAMGRFLLIAGLFYFYDLGEWETQKGTLAKDRTTYVNAGLPIELDRLHWLICGMEGALTLNSRVLAGRGSFDRGRLSDLWFSAMFNRFKHWNREFGWDQTPTNAATERLKDKWISHPEINLHELLFDLCDVLEITDKPGAQRYFDYWSQI